MRPLSHSLRPLVRCGSNWPLRNKGSNGATLAQTLSIDARLAVPGPSPGYRNPSAKFHDFIILRWQPCCSPAYLTRHYKSDEGRSNEKYQYKIISRKKSHPRGPLSANSVACGIFRLFFFFGPTFRPFTFVQVFGRDVEESNRRKETNRWPKVRLSRIGRSRDRWHALGT